MRFGRLGLAGAHVSRAGLGGNTFGRYCDQRATAAIVDRALGLGVNFIDTAESYSDGVSEELLGKALKGRRHEVVLATKTGSLAEPPPRLTRARILGRLEASLKRLGTDHVDLYYLHFPDPLTPIEESLRAMEDMVRSGKVIYPACSNYSGWQIAEMLGICRSAGLAPPVVSQSPYNLLDRRVAAEVIPACLNFGLSLVPYSPLAGGFLTGKYRPGEPAPSGSRGEDNDRFHKLWLQDGNFAALDRYRRFAEARGHSSGELALAWLAAQPVVCSVIAGATSPEQVELNVRAVDWELSEADLAELEAAEGSSPL